MRRRIFRHLFWLAAGCSLLAAFLVLGLMYTQYYDGMKQEIRRQAALAADGVNLSGTVYLSAVKDDLDGSRVTLVAADGAVLFDSFGKADAMDDHRQRPEIADALSDGWGEATRLSDTVGQQAFYCAVRLEDGTVLRVAGVTASVWRAAASCLPWLLLLLLLLFGAAAVVAHAQTRRLIAPLNVLDLDRPLMNETYEEITPLLRKLDQQKDRLTRQRERLEQQQTEFQSITQNMDEGLVVLSLSGAVVSVNKAALRIFKTESLPEQCSHYLALSRHPAFQKAAEQALAGKTDAQKLLLDGRWYHLMAAPVSDTVPRGAVLLILDITDRQEAEQRRREFSANVSHELKTPLTAIRGFAEIIENGIAQPADVPRFARTIEDEASRLIALVEDILRLSRLDEGDPALPAEKVELKALCREAAERLGPLAGEKSVTFALTGPFVAITGVRALLSEMVYNLCENAVKYNRPGGRVQITLADDGEMVRLAVADTGIGIPADQQDRVFERFYRVDTSHSRRTGGTGLGLSIVKNAALYHGGSVALESVEGEGSTFTVMLPKTFSASRPDGAEWMPAV